MAMPDHKALARPLNPHGGKSIPSLGRPHRTADTLGKSRQQLALRVDAINAAKNDIALLVIESEAARKALARGASMRSGCWPLPQVCTQNLAAAIHFLDQYAELLRREPMMES
ncbi:hypothetical protein ISN76_12185 [Dyella halodurans]|uniref:Uncharacterized protein n=1 Tax=Dyella halodurans TaxID=1920171 RepID=A0ABV9C1K9_9GAMM|nr:hypothetical protein [Dyella halodurans]